MARGDQLITEISYNAFCMQWHVKMVLIYDGTELTEVFRVLNLSKQRRHDSGTPARRWGCRKMHTAARNSYCLF